MASSTIELPDGGSATFRDPSTITERQRRPVMRAQVRLAGSAIGQILGTQPEPVADDADEATKAAYAEANEAYSKAILAAIADDAEYDMLETLNDALAAAMLDRVVVVVNDLPVTLIDGGTDVDGVVNLPHAVYDAVRTYAAKHFRELMPEFSPNPNPESPTPPSVN